MTEEQFKKAMRFGRDYSIGPIRLMKALQKQGLLSPDSTDYSQIEIIGVATELVKICRETGCTMEEAIDTLKRRVKD